MRLSDYVNTGMEYAEISSNKTIQILVLLTNIFLWKVHYKLFYKAGIIPIPTPAKILLKKITMSLMNIDAKNLYSLLFFV